ncbi:MAG: carbon-nitrogen hydrolase family protein [Rubrivivax sp.]|nr:MAG: carbon-nitrogen hydrolase family protein [Rubrivivax sp.]
MTLRRFRAAVVQTHAELGDLATNIARSRQHVLEAVRQGAQLVVLPECMNSGYLFDSKAHCLTLAEPLDGAYCQALAQMAREHGIHLGAGLTERGDDGQAYNSAVLFDPSGALIGHYRKQFLPAQDQRWFSVGDLGNPVVDTALGRIGLLVCFDGRIPEVARCLAAQGAEIILDMANFFVMGQADLFVPARAMENGVWILAATKAGVERSIYYPGGSLIVAPTGEVRARIANDAHGVAVAEIVVGTEQGSAWANGGCKWADRRPQAYGLMARRFDDTPLAPLLNHALAPGTACVKIAAVQAHADSQHGTADGLAMARHAVLLGARLLAMPLHFGAASAAPTAADAARLAARTPALIDELHQLCAEHGVFAVLPTIEAGTSGLWPVAVLIGRQGVIGRQPQVHLAPQDKAWAGAEQAHDFVVFDTPIGRLGIAMGHDGLFPESTRVLALLGADIVMWPSAWQHPDERRLLAVSRAVDNRLYLVCANRADAPCPGGSFVIPPNGFPHWDVDVNAPPTTRWGAVMPMFAELALARQKCMEPGVDLLRNRLPHTYGVLTQSPLPSSHLTRSTAS